MLNQLYIREKIASLHKNGQQACSSVRTVAADLGLREGMNQGLHENEIRWLIWEENVFIGVRN